MRRKAQKGRKTKLARKEISLPVYLLSMAVVAGGAAAMTGTRLYARLKERGRAWLGLAGEPAEEGAAEETPEPEPACPAAQPQETGPRQPEERLTVQFFDWDGSFLAARVVEKGGSLRGDHRTPASRGSAPDEAPLPPSGEILYSGEPDGSYRFYGTGDPRNSVMNKLGYSFAGWVDWSEPAVPAVSYKAARGQRIPAEKLVALDDIRRPQRLKAAYHESPELIGENSGTRKYLIAIEPRRGEDGGLDLAISVRRPENARRIADNGKRLRVELCGEQGQILTSYHPLGDRDREDLHLRFEKGPAPSRGHTLLRLALLDEEDQVRSPVMRIELEGSYRRSPEAEKIAAVG